MRVITLAMLLLSTGCIDGNAIGIPGATDQVFECSCERAGEAFEVELCFEAGQPRELEQMIVRQEPGVVSATCRSSGRGCVLSCPSDPADWQCNAENGCYCAHP